MVSSMFVDGFIEETFSSWVKEMSSIKVMNGWR